MKIKVIMSDKAMTRPVMDDRERMLQAALSSDAERDPMSWTATPTRPLPLRKW